MKTLLTICLLLTVSQSWGKQLPQHQKGDDLKPSHRELDPNYLPLNVAGLVGQPITLRCGILNAQRPHSVQWTEFAHNPNGSPISDNGTILDVPEKERYTIINNVTGHYDLHIRSLRLDDGGVYVCREAQTNPPLKYQHGCSLTVLEPTLNCTSTINPNGIVLDHSYQINECMHNFRGPIVPNMTWSGIAPFVQAYTATNQSVWAGMNFNVTRQMDTRAHTCTTFFTGYFLPLPGDFANNVPERVIEYQGLQMYVYWGPTAQSASPIKPVYDAGDVLTCVADAFPPATFFWQNLRTNGITNGPTVRVDESWRGFNQSMRCEARNTIGGTIYSNNIFIPVDVAPLTTPTTTTMATTTTPPPPVSPCTDLTGAWVSSSPTRANLCVRLDLSNQGLLTGLLKNHTDPYWVDIVGRATANRFEQVGFNGIWPASLGVSSFIGECHRCFGEEQILVNVISRSKGSPCGSVGPTRYTTQYRFIRSQALQCPNLPTIMHA